MDSVTININDNTVNKYKNEEDDKGFYVTNNGIYKSIGCDMAKLVLSKESFIEAYKRYIENEDE